MYQDPRAEETDHSLISLTVLPVFASVCVCLSRARKCRKIVFKKASKKKKGQNERIGYIRKREKERGVETGDGTTAGTADLFQ